MIQSLALAGYIVSNVEYSGPKPPGANHNHPWILSVAGWNRVGELQHGLPGSKHERCFVAMWFDEEVRLAYEQGIQAGIKDAGFDPYRVDYVQSNDLLDDVILAGIRESRFMVADLTAHRHNAYLEVGFAMGLGLPVIFTCRRDHMNDLKFDVSHYPVIDWTQPADLCERLRTRIVATIGIGPLKRSNNA